MRSAALLRYSTIQIYRDIDTLSHTSVGKIINLAASSTSPEVGDDKLYSSLIDLHLFIISLESVSHLLQVFQQTGVRHQTHEVTECDAVM